MFLGSFVKGRTQRERGLAVSLQSDKQQGAEKIDVKDCSVYQIRRIKSINRSSIIDQGQEGSCQETRRHTWKLLGSFQASSSESDAE
jgi:hypothetical protein